MSAPAPYGPAPAPRTMVAPSSPSDGSAVQITQPPKGSFTGAPSSVTSARPAPEPAMARSDTPCVVGLAPALEPRRNSDTPGAVSSAWSSRGVCFRISGPICTALNAASPPSGASLGG